MFSNNGSVARPNQMSICCSEAAVRRSSRENRGRVGSDSITGIQKFLTDSRLPLSGGIFRNRGLFDDSLYGFSIAQQIEGSSSRFQAYFCNPVRDKSDQFCGVGLHVMPPPSLSW